MAGSYNKVLLIGNLTRDIELRQLPNSNTSVANIGLAVNRKFRTADGESREEVTFVDCEAFGRTAETMSQYLRKGRAVFIEGRLRLDQWEDKEGQKRSKMKVVVDNFQFLDSGRSEGDEGGSRGGAEGGARKPGAPARAPAAAGGANYEPVPEDDIPV